MQAETQDTSDPDRPVNDLRVSVPASAFDLPVAWLMRSMSGSAIHAPGLQDAGMRRVIEARRP